MSNTKTIKLLKSLSKSYGPGHFSYSGDKSKTKLSYGPANSDKKDAFRTKKLAASKAGLTGIAKDKARDTANHQAGNFNGSKPFSSKKQQGGNSRLTNTDNFYQRSTKSDYAFPKKKAVKDFTAGPSEKGKSFFGKSQTIELLKGIVKKENKAKKNKTLDRLKHVYHERNEVTGDEGVYSRKPNWPSRDDSNKNAGRDQYGKAETKTTASDRQKKNSKDPFYKMPF